jgi:Spy/CpxP family protein refolding chaperone
MPLVNTPTPRVWLATFVALVFTIGVLAGIVVERSWLHPAFVGGRGGPRFGGPGGPGEPGRGPDGRGPDGRGGPDGRNGRGGGRPMFGPPPQQYVEDLSKELKLTDPQKSEVLKLLEAQETRLRSLQEESRKVFISEQEALQNKIAALLTPEQATAFREWSGRRMGRRGGPGAGPR